MSSVKFLLSSLDSFYLFVFSLTAMAGTSKSMLTNRGRVGTLVLFLILDEMLFFPALRIVFSVGLSYLAFIILMYVPSVLTFGLPL